MLVRYNGRRLIWLLPGCRYDVFLGEFKKTFAHPESESGTVQRLLSLRQGHRSVADFLIDFHTAAAATGWPGHVVHGIFLQALNEDMRDQLASRDEPTTFEGLASLALRIGNRLRGREPAKTSRPPRAAARSFPVACAPAPTVNPVPEPPAVATAAEAPPEPMQIGWSQLSLKERQRRVRSWACFFCASQGHFVAHCPKLAKGAAHS